MVVKFKIDQTQIWETPINEKVFTDFLLFFNFHLYYFTFIKHLFPIHTSHPVQPCVYSAIVFLL